LGRPSGSPNASASRRVWLAGLPVEVEEQLAEIRGIDLEILGEPGEIAGSQAAPCLLVVSDDRSRSLRLAAFAPAMVLVVGTNETRRLRELKLAGVEEVLPADACPALVAERALALLEAREEQSQVRSERDALVRAHELARLGSWELDPDTLEMNWSNSMFSLLGIEPNPSGENLETLLAAIHPEDRERFRRKVSRALHGGSEFILESRLHTNADIEGQQKTRRIQQQGARIPGARQGMRVFGIAQDVTEQRSAEDEARRLAYYDSLTGLANRRLFREELEQATQKARDRGHLLALLYIDVDRFKQINDSLGHAAGDLFLQHVADVLRKRVRRTDLVGRVEMGSPPATISRLGGDEFAILLGRIAREEDAGDVAIRILRALPRRFVIDGQEVSTTGSVGIAVYPRDGTDVDTLIKHADTAMYAAKDRGRNTFTYFHASMRQDITRKLQVEAELRQGLERNELLLHFQPRVELRSQRVVAAEALIRWQHPTRGLLAPKEFLSIAEQAGLMPEIGEFVLERACAESKAWRKHGLRLPVSVNVSPRQLEDGGLHEIVSEALRRTGLLPGDLEVELTENLMLSEGEETARALRELQAIGVRIALDDFGTGYASLSSLSMIPLDVLKLDRTLLRNVDIDPAAAGIASAVIAMAHTLGLRVVAEGVDNPAQVDFLLEHNCEEAQGFLYSPALPSAELIRFIERLEQEKPEEDDRPRLVVP